MNALRLASGTSDDLFAARTGLLPEDIYPQIKLLQDEGFLKPLRSNYCTTDLGARYLDTILQRFS